MGGIGQQELILLMAFALIFFGAKKLPEIARGIVVATLQGQCSKVFAAPRNSNKDVIVLDQKL